MTRTEIMQQADEMIGVRWSPPSTIQIREQYSSREYRKGVTYIGVPYHWWGNDSASSFLQKVSEAEGGPLSAGNDCSSFINHAWQVPERLTTASIEADSIGSQTWCQALAGPGECEGVGLALGDACNKANWHVILVGEILAGGVTSAEQTPGPRESETEMRRFWSWKWLRDHGYRPVRRAGVEDEATWTLRWQPTYGATWYRLWISRDGNKWLDRWLQDVKWEGAVPPGSFRWWIQPWSVEGGRREWIAGPDFIEPRKHAPGMVVERSVK